MRRPAKKIPLRVCLRGLQYVRISFLSASTFVLIDFLYLFFLHLFTFFGANEDGVINHTWWDITQPMGDFWFSAHQPWSGYVQPYFDEIWVHPHYTQIDPTLIYQFEALCVLQSALVGFLIGIFIAALLFIKHYFYCELHKNDDKS